MDSKEQIKTTLQGDFFTDNVTPKDVYVILKDLKWVLSGGHEQLWRFFYDREDWHYRRVTTLLDLLHDAKSEVEHFLWDFGQEILQLEEDDI